MNLTPPATKPSNGAIIASIVLGVVVGLLWLLQLATVASLGGSDPAGDAIGRAYAAIEIIALWLLLMVMTVIAGVKGAAPRPAVVAALASFPSPASLQSAPRICWRGRTSRHFCGPSSFRRWFRRWSSRGCFPGIVGRDAAPGHSQSCRRRVAGERRCGLRLDLAAVADAQGGGRSGGRAAAKIR